MAAADEVWRLQNGTDAESAFFQRMIGQKKPGGGSRQGVYLATPDGELLGRINTRNASRVEKMLREGLAKWERMASKSAAGAPEFPRSDRWESDLPAGGLTLRLFKRDIEPTPEPAMGRVWNLDHAWFSAEEASALLPRQIVVGMRTSVPRAIATRLSRFHLVDNVTGQSLPFAEAEIRRQDMWLEVTAVDSRTIRARLTGQVICQADSWLMGLNDWTPRRPWPRRLETVLRGQVEVDVATRRVLRFDVVGLADWAGRTRFNARRTPSGRFAVAISLVGEEAAQIAPAFVDVYDAPWIGTLRRPTVVR